jgi:signal transduction histidine kinase/CheY-like chemotaxis protein
VGAAPRPRDAALTGPTQRRRYVTERLRIGIVHHRVRLEPQWYLATYAHFLADHAKTLIERAPVDGVERFITLLKTVFFDAALALDAYGMCIERAVHAGAPAADAPAATPSSGTPSAPAQPVREPTFTRIQLTQNETERRRGFLQLDESSMATLASLGVELDAAVPSVLDDFYALLSSSSETAALVPPLAIERLKAQVGAYWAELTRGTFDRAHAASRMRVGVVHERIGITCQLYLTGLARQLAGILRHLARTRSDAATAIPALLRAVFFDITFVIDAYMEARAESVLRTDGYASQLVAGLSAGVAVVDESLRIESANPVLLELLGIDAALVHRMNVADAIPLRGLPAKITRIFEEDLPRLTTTGRFYEREVHISLIQLRPQHGSRERQKVAIVVDELATLRKLVGTLEHTSRSFDELVSSLGTTIWEADPRTWTMLLVSRPVLQLTGLRDVHWLGRAGAWPAAIPEPDRTRFLDTCARLSVGDRARIEHRIEHASGRLLWLESEVSRVRLRDGAEVFSGVSIDVSQSHFEHERRLDAIGQLGGGVAHEFNNLLTIVLSSLAVVEDQVHDPSVLESVRTAMAAARRGGTLTQQLLTFSRRQLLRPSDVVLSDVVRSMAPRLERIVGPSIAVRDEHPDERWTVRADPELLREAILHLVTNARDAMPHGGHVALTTCHHAKGPHDGGAPMEGDTVELEVRDDGVGMPEAVRARAFEPFFTTRPAGMGCGLGLSMVYGFVTQSGGHVSLDSTPGVGTSVRLTLPRAPASSPSETIAAPRNEDVTILLVDDEPLLLRAVARLLKRRDYQVVVATSVDEALHILGERVVHVLLTDYAIGQGPTGLDLAREARTLHPELGVIVSSGYMGSDVQQSDVEGFLLLPKPFSEESLFETVARTLTQAR